MNLLSEIISDLEFRSDRLRAAGDLGLAFAAWADPTSVRSEDFTRERNRCVALAGAQRRYSDVASLGFIYRCRPEDKQVAEHAADGMAWMVGRSTRVEGNYADFCSDPLALLGFTQGLGSLESPENAAEWLQSVVQADIGKETPWDSSIRELALHALGADSGRAFIPEVKVLGLAKGLVTARIDSSDCDHVISRLKGSTLPQLSDVEAFTLLFALRYLERAQPLLALQAPNVAAVVQVLASLKNGLTRWTWETKAKTGGGIPRKWHIDNEYHVQNLLWCILRPLFPDAKEEEYKSAVGRLHPRLDIVLPSLKLIVEAKFWRRRDASKEMVREIAEDSGLYLTVDKPYDSILAVIWDDGRRVEEHDSLRQALTEIDGVVDAVIIAKPGLMEDEVASAC